MEAIAEQVRSNGGQSVRIMRDNHHRQVVFFRLPHGQPPTRNAPTDGYAICPTKDYYGNPIFVGYLVCDGDLMGPRLYAETATTVDRLIPLLRALEWPTEEEEVYMNITYRLRF